MGKILLILVVLILVYRVSLQVRKRKSGPGKPKVVPTKAGDLSQINVSTSTIDTSLKKQFRTVIVFTKLSTKRFMRDRLAQFFAIIFPLIFLFVFGGLSKNGNNVSFNVAVINESKTAFAKSFTKELKKSKVFDVKPNVTSISEANTKLDNSEIDGAIVLPPSFGEMRQGQSYPSGRAQLIYSANNSETGSTLATVLSSEFNSINSRYVKTAKPFTVAAKPLSHKSLTSFDYTFSGLLGFSIIGLGIFGPVNVFPELKKQGILRRLHTTPLRVWQYFLATMLSQSITGIVAIAIQFGVAISLFGLKVDGNYLEIFLFVIYSIFMILGLGLAIGGWAKNERQAAPLSNIVVFPMLFLSGTFFPRYVMPIWLQKVTDFLPLTPVIDGLRDLTTEGKDLFQILPQIGLIAAWLIVIYFIAFRVFRWE
jgi:ABC-2 type transport system permease protein